MKNAEVTPDDLRLTDEAFLQAVFADLEAKTAREEAEAWQCLHALCPVAESSALEPEVISAKVKRNKRCMFAAAAMTAITMAVFAVDMSAVAAQLKLDKTVQQLMESQEVITVYAAELSEAAWESNAQYLAKQEAVQQAAAEVAAIQAAQAAAGLQNRDYIERVVAAEARGEPFEGMMAVAQVIRDRAELWDMTPYEVVTQRSQFAPPYQGAISAEVKLAVAKVFDEGERVFTEPVTHFYSGSATPYWTASKVNRGTVGRHKFWY